MMDFNKLSVVKRGIIRSCVIYGYTTDSTYRGEKEWLYKKGWLQGNQTKVFDTVHIISGQYMLTPEGKRAYEAAAKGNASN